MQDSVEYVERHPTLSTLPVANEAASRTFVVLFAWEQGHNTATATSATKN